MPVNQPRSWGRVLVLVESFAESVSSVDFQVGEAGLLGDGCGSGGTDFKEVPGQQCLGLAAQEVDPGRVLPFGCGRDAVLAEDLPDGGGGDPDPQRQLSAVLSASRPSLKMPVKSSTVLASVVPFGVKRPDHCTSALEGSPSTL